MLCRSDLTAIFKQRTSDVNLNFQSRYDFICRKVLTKSNLFNLSPTLCEGHQPSEIVRRVTLSILGLLQVLLRKFNRNRAKYSHALQQETGDFR